MSKAASNQDEAHFPCRFTVVTSPSSPIKRCTEETLITVLAYFYIITNEGTIYFHLPEKFFH